MDLLERLFSPDFMPHGHCYRWTPWILWGHAISDMIVAIAYFSIPFVLVVFTQKRKDVAFSWVVILFASFIVACGVGHLLDVWNIWHGAYELSAVVRMITAGVSLATAVVLWPLLPKVLKIPSPHQLREEIVIRREAEKGLRKARDSLEERVKERTGELEAFAKVAVDREDQMIALKRRINTLCAELGRTPEHDLSFLDKA